MNIMAEYTPENSQRDNLYNDKRLLSDKDRLAINWVYKRRRDNNEIKEDIRHNYKKCIDEATELYFHQKQAFSDVLTEDGFDLTQKVLKDYPGRIAILTNHGTFIILGKLGETRHMTMKRIHTPEYNIYDGSRVIVDKDINIGEQASIYVPSKFNGFNSSNVRGLATKLHGADNDELEDKACATLANDFLETYREYTEQPLRKSLDEHPGLVVRY